MVGCLDDFRPSHEKVLFGNVYSIICVCVGACGANVRIRLPRTWDECATHIYIYIFEEKTLTKI